MVSRREAIGALLGGAVCRGQEDSQSRQATGVKIGEVTSDSAVIWTRLTASANRLADGIVRRGTDQVPERAPVRHAFQPATLLREDVFVADAATEQTWRWRRDGRPLGTYTSRDLATRCIASLTARLDEVAVATGS